MHFPFAVYQHYVVEMATGLQFISLLSVVPSCLFIFFVASLGRFLVHLLIHSSDFLGLEFQLTEN